MSETKIINDSNEMDGDVVIEMTNDEGKVFYCIEDMTMEIAGKRFAVLIPVSNEDACGCECDCDTEDQDEDDCECGDAIIARVDKDENGEDVYVDPTDEEYEWVCEAYEEMLEADEEEAE